MKRPFGPAPGACLDDVVAQRKKHAVFEAAVAIANTLAKRHPRLVLFDPTDALCDSTECDYVEDDHPLTRDWGHPRAGPLRKMDRSATRDVERLRVAMASDAEVVLAPEHDDVAVDVVAHVAVDEDAVTARAGGEPTL